MLAIPSFTRIVFPAERIVDSICYHGRTCAPGYVYLAQYGDLHKIGYVNLDPKCPDAVKRIGRRMRSVLSSHGYLLTPRYYLETACAYGLEQALHRYFGYCRIRDESYFYTVISEYFWIGAPELAGLRRLDSFKSQPVTFHTVR